MLVAGTLVFSHLCSVLEAVILSITPGFVEARRRVGGRTGLLLHSLKKDIDRPLSAILTLNTIANTAGSSAVGWQAGIVFENLSAGVTSGVLTFLVLIFSEIIPKTLGATNWRRFSTPTVWVTQALIVSLYPVVMFANRIAMLVARGRPVVRVSRGEIRAIAGLGHSQGVIAEDESRMIESVITFGSLAVRDVMTPRPVVVALDESLDMSDAADADLRPSRIPIYRDTIDSVTGYVLRYDLLLAVARGDGNLKVGSLRRDIQPLPDALSLRDAFSKLLSGREHIALIVDQYGGTAGIVTLEDIVETLLGLEIVDETDRETDMQELARRLWAARVRRSGLSVSDEGITETPLSETDPIDRHNDAGDEEDDSRGV